MKKVLLFLIVIICALNSWAQSPLLKTVEAPDTTTPMVRAEGWLNSHWTQDFPYNQLCPSGTISVAGWEKGIYFLQVKGEGTCETAKFVVK